MANGANHELPLTTEPEALVRLEGAPESAFGETILARVDGVWQAFVRASSFRAFEPLGLRAPPRCLVDQVPPKVVLLTNDGGEHTLLPVPDDRERVRALLGPSAAPSAPASVPSSPSSPAANSVVAASAASPPGNVSEAALAAAMLALLERQGAPLGTDPMAVQRVHEAARVAAGELLREGAATVNLPYLTATDQGPLHLNLSFVRNATNCAVFDLSTSPPTGRSAPVVLVVVVALLVLVLGMLLVLLA